MGYLRVLWTRGCKIPYVYLIGSIRFTCGHPRGHCGFHTGMGTSVQFFRALRGTVRLSNARPGYIYQAKHDYVTFYPLGPGRLLTGLLWAPKSLVAHIWKLYMLSLQPRDIERNSKFIETVCGLVLHAEWFSTCLHMLGPYGARRLSQSYGPWEVKR